MSDDYRKLPDTFHNIPFSMDFADGPRTSPLPTLFSPFPFVTQFCHKPVPLAPELPRPFEHARV